MRNTEKTKRHTIPIANLKKKPSHVGSGMIPVTGSLIGNKNGVIQKYIMMGNQSYLSIAGTNSTKKDRIAAINDIISNLQIKLLIIKSEVHSLVV